MSSELVLDNMTLSETVSPHGVVPGTAILPIAGGKGGTGKSTLTANLGVGMSLLGHKVILLDGDLGGADLHLFFDQIAPARSLSHFLTREVKSLNDVLLPTPLENLQLICGGNEMIGLANLPYGVKEKIVRHVGMLEADYVLIDLGAGTSFNTLDLFSLSDVGIIVCNPEPHSRVDAYGFIKNVVYRKLRRAFNKNEDVRTTIEQFARGAGRKVGRMSELLDEIERTDAEAGGVARYILKSFCPRLVLNRVRNKGQIEERLRFIGLVREYLSVEMEYIGYVRSDSRILDACERRRPVLIDNPQAPSSRDISRVLMEGLNVPDRLGRIGEDETEKLVEFARAEAMHW